MKKYWLRWIKSSFFTHFSEALPELRCYIEEEDPATGERVVVRTTCEFDDISYNKAEAQIGLNVLLAAQIAENNIYGRADLEGDVLVAYSRGISIYRYGYDDTFANCAEIVSPVTVTSLHREQDLQYTIFDATYSVELEKT